MKNSLKKVLVFLVFLVLASALAVTALTEGGVEEPAPEETPVPVATSTPDPACAHNGGMVLIRVKRHEPATCTSPGYQIAEFSCKLCGAYMGEYRQDTEEAALGHAWVTETVASECTAGSDGKETHCSRCGAVSESSPASGHNWVQMTREAQHCNEKTGTWEECTKCGAKRNEVYTTTLFTHTYTVNSQVITKEPTCTEDGANSQKCDCGATTIYLPIKKLAHTWVEGLTVAATCRSAGYEYRECSVCHTKEKGKILEMTDHDWVEYEVYPAGCTHTGTMGRKCSVCGTIDSGYSKEIPMKDHVWGNVTKKDATSHGKKCTVCGEWTDVEAHTPDRNIADVKCNETVNCTVCGYAMKTGTAHDYKWVDSTDLVHIMKCSVCGATGSTELHKWDNGGDCTKTRTCSVCGKQVAAQASHNLGAWSNSGDNHTRKCQNSGCNYSETEPHQWTEWTLVADHNLNRSCPVCNITQNSYTSQVITPTPAPTATPSPVPTATKAPKAAPTATPTKAPTATPTKAPTATPTTAPTATPTKAPTATPTTAPTATPTKAPTATPTTAPTATPTKAPTATPTTAPTATPTKAPTATPTTAPTSTPTKAPTATPTTAPTSTPTTAPTATPTKAPTATPTTAPTSTPTKAPTATPTTAPTSTPTTAPTATPTTAPTSTPTKAPTAMPTTAPTSTPTTAPTATPAKAPTATPTTAPTSTPTKAPTATPTTAPTTAAAPKATATDAPTATATVKPNETPPQRRPRPKRPTAVPTAGPTATAAPETTEAVIETEVPTPAATEAPAATTTAVVTDAPTAVPTAVPTAKLTDVPASKLAESAHSVAAALALPDDVTLDFKPVAGAAVVNSGAADDQVVLLAAEIPEVPAAAKADAYTAFTVSRENGASDGAPVTVSMKVSVDGGEGLAVPTEQFKVVRVAEDGALIEVEFSYEDSVLTFEMDEDAVYLLIPA